MLRQLSVFIYWLPKNPDFWLTSFSQHSQLGYLWLSFSNCAAPVLLTGCYNIPVVAWYFPPNPPREAEDFSIGSNHSKHVPLITYLAWLQPIIHNLGLIFKHVKTTNILLVLKSLIKKHKVIVTLISSHESASYLK